MSGLNCRVCRRCNRKGRPSVSKYSVGCEKRRDMYRPSESMVSWKKSFVGKKFNRISGLLKGFLH